MATLTDLMNSIAGDPAARLWATGPVAVYCSFPQQKTPPGNTLKTVPFNNTPIDPNGPTLKAQEAGQQTSLNAASAFPNYNTYFFGWAERVPTIRFQPSTKKWTTDVGGPTHGADYWWTGAEATVSSVFTAWNEVVYSLMQSYARQVTRGRDLVGDVGRWMFAEGCTFQLSCVWPYSKKPMYQILNGMPPGVRFLAAHLSDDGSSNGSTARKLNLSWKCIRAFNPQDSSWTLYIDDVSNTASVDAGFFTPINRGGS